MVFSVLPSSGAVAAVHRSLLYDGSYGTSFGHLSENQQKANQIVLRISSFLSICGSGYIIYNLLGPRRESEFNKQMFSRLLFGLSVSDIMASSALLMGSWPIPKDTYHSHDLVWNIGNQWTCDMQGFALQIFYFSSIFYTTTLSINFLLCVKYQWREEDLRNRVEPFLHIISWSVPFVLAILCQVFDLYNPTAFFCYVVTYPIGCDHYDDVDCRRGDNTWMWRSIAQIVPFGVCFFTIIYCMVNLYLFVRETERNVSRYSSAWVERKARDSRLAWKQAAQYIGVFLAVWAPVLLVALCEDLGQKIPITIWIIDALMIPIVGLFNAIVYSRMIDPIKLIRSSTASIRASLRGLSRSKSVNSRESISVEWSGDDYLNTPVAVANSKDSSKQSG